MEKNSTNFRLDIGSGRRQFAVTKTEQETLEALGREMGFTVEITQDLPARILSGGPVPQKFSLVRMPGE